MIYSRATTAVLIATMEELDEAPPHSRESPFKDKFFALWLDRLEHENAPTEAPVASTCRNAGRSTSSCDKPSSQLLREAACSCVEAGITDAEFNQQQQQRRASQTNNMDFLRRFRLKKRRRLRQWSEQSHQQEAAKKSSCFLFRCRCSCVYSNESLYTPAQTPAEDTPTAGNVSDDDIIFVSNHRIDSNHCESVTRAPALGGTHLHSTANDVTNLPDLINNTLRQQTTGEREPAKQVHLESLHASNLDAHLLQASHLSSLPSPPPARLLREDFPLQPPSPMRPHDVTNATIHQASDLNASFRSERSETPHRHDVTAVTSGVQSDVTTLPLRELQSKLLSRCILKIGRKSSPTDRRPGCFSFPRRIDVLPADGNGGRIVVLDAENRTLQLFTSRGVCSKMYELRHSVRAMCVWSANTVALLYSNKIALLDTVNSDVSATLTLSAARNPRNVEKLRDRGTKRKYFVVATSTEVIVFKDDGSVSHFIGNAAAHQPGTHTTLFRRVNAICVEPRHSDVIVLDGELRLVYVFTQGGQLKTTIDTNSCGVGRVANPLGMCVNRYGYVIIADTFNHRVVQLSQKHSRCLLQYSPDFYPNDVMLTSDGRLVVAINSEGRHFAGVRLYHYKNAAH